MTSQTPDKVKQKSQAQAGLSRWEQPTSLSPVADTYARVRALSSTAGNQSVSDVLGWQTERGFLLFVRGLLPLYKMQQGFGADPARVWVLREAPAGLTPGERVTLENMVDEARRKFQHDHADVFKRRLQTNEIEFTFELPQGDLHSPYFRNVDVVLISDALNDGFHRVFVAEEAAKPKLPGYVKSVPKGSTIEEVIHNQTEILNYRVRTIRHDMDVGERQQRAAKSWMGQFAASTASKAEPGIEGWRQPKHDVEMAEKALAQGDLDTAHSFLDVAQNLIDLQQKAWAQYKKIYDFGDTVIAPVAWKALELLSMGLVDKELVDQSFEVGIKNDFVTQIAVVGKLLGKKIFTILTFGGGLNAYEATEEYQKQHPNDSFCMVLLAGGKAGLMGVADTLLPLHEWDVLTGTEIDPATGMYKDPTSWEKMEAGFSALLKLVSLGEMAKSEIAARRRPKSSPKEQANKPQKIPADTVPDMDFKKTLTKEGWQKYIKDVGPESPKGRALEAGRRKLAEELNQKFKGRRTGTESAASDFDVNFDGPNAERNLEAAKKYLSEKYGLPFDKLQKMLDMNFLSSAKRAYMYDNPNLSPAARARIQEHLSRGSQRRYLERMKALGKETKSKIVEKEFVKQAQELGIDPEQVANRRAMTPEEARQSRMRQDELHNEFDRVVESTKTLKKGSPEAKNANARLEHLAEEIARNQVDIDMRAPEFWHEAGGAYFEPGSVKYRVSTGEPVSISAREAYGDMLNQRLEMMRKLAAVENKLSTGGKMAVNERVVLSQVATEANFSKYTARTLTLSNKYLVKLGSIRKFMLKRRANKIYEAKSDPALLDKIFSKMEPDELVDYARDILDIQDEILRIMEKEVIPQKTKVPLHGMGLRKKEEKESND